MVALESPGPNQGPVEGPEARQIGRRGRFQGLGVFAKGGEEGPGNQRFLVSLYTGTMELAKLSRKGQVHLPRRLLRQLGIEGEGYFLVELSPDGAILLRPVGIYPIESYSQDRVREFLQEDTLTDEERARLARVLG